ncbi:MAG: hypothetical protein AAGC55_26930, partial [Myxococcota bacterium]
MSRAEELWHLFIERASADSAALEQGLSDIRLDRLAEASAQLDGLAYHAFQLAESSLLLGAEEVGALALACERALDLITAGAVMSGLMMPTLVASALTLRQAIDELAVTGAGDRSGAQAASRPLEAARFELETF